MNEGTGDGFRRVIVTIERGDPETLEAAARLARDLGAELVGLYLEDDTVASALDFPGFRLVTGRGPARAAPDDLRRAMRAATAEVQRAFESAGRRWSVGVSFRTASAGAVTSLYAELRAESDLLALPLAGPRLGPRLSALARELMSRAPASVLVLRRAEAAGIPVVVLYEGGAGALRAARDLARGYHAPLHVVALGGDEAEAEARAEEAAERLRALGATAAVDREVIGDEPSLRAGLQNRPCGILVLDRAGPAHRAFAIDAFLAGHPCSAVMVA